LRLYPFLIRVEGEGPPEITKRQALTTTSGGRGSPSGARDSESDPDLAKLMELWPRLPRAIRAGIIGMVEAASEETQTGR